MVGEEKEEKEMIDEEIPKDHQHRWSPHEPYGCWCGVRPYTSEEKWTIRKVMEKLDRGQLRPYEEYAIGDYDE